MNQIELHTTIDKVLAEGIKSVKSSNVSSLINTNEDTKQYFFSRADETWLCWLWDNGFLEAIKEKDPDPNSYGFRMPELHYLVSVADKEPDIVTNIICSFDISVKNFNPEVIDQFTRISSKLPARCLKKIVQKIRNEGWIGLMGKFTQYGFEYADMLETLNKSSDYESILTLAEAVLKVRDKKETEERKSLYRGDNVFYINDISETKVFTYLVEMPSKYQEKALSIIINVFSRVSKEEGNYFLMDEDFFTLRLTTVSGDSYREEFRFLAATIIEITRKLFSDKNQDKAIIYQKNFVKLPEIQTARRLKLFILSLDPQLFIEKLKTEYFRLFETDKVMEVLYGAEYERALRAGFSYLSNAQKREYVTKLFSLFSKPKDEDEKRWKRHYASCILSTISKNLTQEEIALADKKDFKIDPKYQPEPSIGKIRGGTVTPRSPINADDFGSLTVKEIVEKLKGELSPKELQEKYKNDDFLNPRDADGVAGQLKDDIKKRIGEYLDSATLFFDRKKLIPHYTNAYLRGIKDALAENRGELGNLEYDNLFELFLRIKVSGVKESFSKTDKDSSGRWLSNWNSVHSTLADLIEELIKQKDKNTLINFKQYRTKVFEILDYLLNFEDPIPEDEKLKTAKSTIKHPNESEYSISDPFTIAINSVRGRSFQVLLHFVYQDASTNEKIKLADDVKELYREVLKNEETRAIMFMFGHYLPTFYFRDMKWTRNMLVEVFRSKNKDKYLQLSAWEGYLSTNLYKELFFEPYIQDLYSKNITLNLVYPKQKFFKDPQESLSIHFALAFIHFEEFGIDNELFKTFLAKTNEKQLSEFVNFIGKSAIIKEGSNVLKDEKNPWRITRVKSFWELMLKSKTKSAALKEFGSWMEVNNNTFEVKWLANRIAETLDATDGELRWDYELTKSIEKLATESPEEALLILEKHFMWLIENEKHFFPIRDDKEWFSAFKILYKNMDKKTRNATYSLINQLIENGGKPFWILEDIVK
ncbi:MAG: hypothetical protein CO156_04640 [Candidatus Pacebacteria bacterium CG_4_9_14_3_um_filter_40_12]|uniref:Uncharacterized protein n=1 Tax=Candidatus Roizmanbacteria bacterium CG_4_10_14_0_2_um_filter_39_13 TaxID=1974825 RepID=A0A2M7TYR9_9BACT|nr:MAG: hypothetical protein COY16_03155 [Candidatus Roizmanbacteria bacterium CG_4_10_14_0_2_um_filter_39_13]PJA68565.1 MAG: hypothetical protein CO156_04640 [Candidatus Pacebacteria bacterium CG_4_9_14_3_um_filter_40_12]PJC43291.1 MAG: hypothetical protein CO039_04690 [Candidatus Pacebacteria bacterium CG_4_9_14_0_2_um_filter_34_50]